VRFFIVLTLGTNVVQWCENCKLMAPTMLQVEEEYKDRVNFVLVNGDRRDAWPLIEAFGVDAIPHIALVSSDGDVETALIGPVPKRVLEADLDGTCLHVCPCVCVCVRACLDGFVFSLKIRFHFVLRVTHTSSLATLQSAHIKCQAEGETESNSVGNYPLSYAGCIR